MNFRENPAHVVSYPAFGMVLAANVFVTEDVSKFISDLESAKQLLDDSRPTAVNLSWATARLVELAKKLVRSLLFVH